MESILSELIRFIVNLIVLTLVFYAAGRLVVGKKRVQLSNAFVIALLGIVISTLLVVFLSTVPLFMIGNQKVTAGAGISLILSFIVYLLLIRYYYQTGWIGAITVAVVAVVMFFIVSVILANLFQIPFLFMT